MPRAKKSALAPRKRPLQARSQATVRAILEAAARVLARESLAGFNTNRVAEIAGISVGSLYQYFPNKEALVTALIEEAQTALAAQAHALAAALDGADLDAKLAGVARLAIEQQYANPILAAALDHEEKRLPLGARLRRTEQALMQALGALLAPHLPGLSAVELRDALVIVKALVESEADNRVKPVDLEARVLRGLRGYLSAGGG